MNPLARTATPDTFARFQSRHAPMYFSKHWGVAGSSLGIRSNEQTAEWRARLIKYLESHGIRTSTYWQKRPEREVGNALNTLCGKPAKINGFD